MTEAGHDAATPQDREPEAAPDVTHDAPVMSDADAAAAVLAFEDDAAGGSETPAGFGEDEGSEQLGDDEFRSALEAMLLVVDAPAPAELLASALNDTTRRVTQVLREMSAELNVRRSGMDLRFVGDGWRYYTRNEYAPYVERMLLDGARSKLTRAALETLAVIAYRQPVTRARVSAVRGVNVDGVIRTLLARGLITEAGTDPETNGTLYSTTELFLERVGLASLADLPPLAPLLPGVDLIDEINESLETDPRFTRLKKPAEADIDLGTED
ncbi:SMC-Scp complex subunit ScpB [Nocardia yamanashiensis]|nr:SMC-Scp complex subunit ScpB [Nocardia yamanashiensis]UGT45025.1 SMC-Scp complex subunit ScpB [Nocardia yamanashiensis]